MALLTLTVNNPSTALDKQHQETQLIARAAPSATGYPREWWEENVRQHQRRRRRFTRLLDLHAASLKLTDRPRTERQSHDHRTHRTP